MLLELCNLTEIRRLNHLTLRSDHLVLLLTRLGLLRAFRSRVSDLTACRREEGQGGWLWVLEINIQKSLNPGYLFKRPLSVGKGNSPGFGCAPSDQIQGVQSYCMSPREGQKGQGGRLRVLGKNIQKLFSPFSVDYLF